VVQILSVYLLLILLMQTNYVSISHSIIRTISNVHQFSFMHYIFFASDTCYSAIDQQLISDFILIQRTILVLINSI